LRISEPPSKANSADLAQQIVIPAKRSASRDRKKDRRFDLLRSRIRLRLSGTTAAALRYPRNYRLRCGKNWFCFAKTVVGASLDRPDFRRRHSASLDKVAFIDLLLKQIYKNSMVNFE
jgi:hypothetical protein